MRFIKLASALLALLVAFPVFSADTVNLPPGYRLTVTADAVSAGSFWRLKDTDNASFGSPTSVSASSSGTAGPFQVKSSWAINSTVGALTSTQAPVHFTDAETIDGINGAELLQRDGSIPLTANWDVGAYTVTGTRFISDIATGTAPLTVASTTAVSNLNADLLDGVEAAAIGQLAVAAEWTATQNFNATTLTGLGADSVPNGAFTDGDDLVTNGAFAADTDWVKGDGWTIAAGVADSDGTQSADSDLTQTIGGLTNGEVYSIVFTGANRTAGNVTVVCGDTEGTDRSTNATFTELVTCGAGGDLDVRADVDYDGDVDDVTLALVGDAGWTQGTGWLISGGNASSDGTQVGDSDLEDDANAPVAGNTYEVKFTVSGYSAGNVTAVVGNQEGTDRSSDATFTELITATNTDVLKIRADVDFVGNIDNVSMKLANVSWAAASNQVTGITLDQNLVMDDPTGMVDGAIYTLHLIQDGTGSRIPTWGSAYLWEGGTIPTLTTTATTGHDIFRFISDGSSMFLISDTLDLQ